MGNITQIKNMIQVLGIPFDANSSFLRGPALAPSRIRQMEKDGSANCFAENGQEILNGLHYTDAGDIVFSNEDPASAFTRIKKTVDGIIKESNKLLCLGGDHSVSYPIIDAFCDKYKDLNILHLDAHADLYENFENNIYSHASPFARIMETGKIKSLTQVGIRTLNTHQRQQADKYHVHLVEMKNFTLSFLQTLKEPLYISLDLDVLDPAYAPGVSHHEPGGLSTRELIHILQQINTHIIGADIVELNPNRDVNNMTAMVAYKLMKELLAKML
jgi:arginase